MMILDLIKKPFRNPAINRYRSENGKVCIEFSLANIQQLFDDRDPSPFLDRDLTSHAQEYIVGAAREFSQHTDYKLVLRVKEEQLKDVDQDVIKKAIHSFFAYEKSLLEQKLIHNLRRARSAFGIGIIFLLACMLINQMIETYLSQSVLSNMLKEGFMIGGWIALWRPIDIVLYGWWPISDDIQSYAKLSCIEVEFHPLPQPKSN